MNKPGNIFEWRLAAKRRLPTPLFNYIDGGADNEHTLARNCDAFSNILFSPRGLVDVDKIDTRATLFGQRVSMPLMLSPTGMSRLFHSGKELAASKAAGEAGIIYSLSTMSTTSLEDVAHDDSGPKVFQVYIFRDRELSKEFVERCKAAEYSAICLTIDTPLAGNRERDRIAGMTMPPRFTPNSLLSFATHPGWVIDFLKAPNFQLANVQHRVDALNGGSMGLMDYVNSQFDRTANWDDAAWLAQEWGGAFIVKGVMSIADAIKAKEIGASAIMISNHGGRQLDDTPAPIEQLEAIREAVGTNIEIIVDGGVRRGSDVVKALCLGANACSIGRPYLFGLAARGKVGVSEVISIFRAEIERTMALLGRRDIDALDASAIHNFHREGSENRI